jgi:hypothetical protein
MCIMKLFCVVTTDEVICAHDLRFIVCLGLTSVYARRWLYAAARGILTQGVKLANEIHCAYISYITNQNGYTYNTELHEQRKLET